MKTSYDNLTVSEYGRIMEVLKEGGEDVTARLYEICSGKSEAEAMRTPLPEFMAALKDMEFLKVSPFEGMKSSDVGVVSLRGRKYRVTASKGATAAQYIDMQAVLKRQKEETAAQSLVSVLSCCLVPDGCVYGEGYDFEDVRRAVGDMTVRQAVGVFAFFLKRCEKSMRRSLFYSIPMVAGMRVKMSERVALMRRTFQTLRDLRKNGVGGFGLMR